MLVDIRGEAERKRLEYLVGKWRGVVGVERLCSGVLLLDAGPGEAMKFVEELYTRFDSDRVRVYRLAEPDFDVEPLVLEDEIPVPKGMDVWSIVGFVMARLRGVLVSAAGGSRRYRLRTRYGVAEVVFTLSGDRLRVSVSGYGEAVAAARSRVLEELSPLRKEQ